LLTLLFHMQTTVRYLIQVLRLFWALSLVSRSISGEELLFFGFLRYKVVSIRIE
jgi:hypothetical protein